MNSPFHSEKWEYENRLMREARERLDGSYSISFPDLSTIPLEEKQRMLEDSLKAIKKWEQDIVEVHLKNVQEPRFDLLGTLEKIICKNTEEK